MTDNLTVRLQARIDAALAKVERQKDLLEAAKQDLKYWQDFRKTLDRIENADLPSE